MPDRPSEFTDIDLDEEDDEDKTQPGPSEDEPLEPIEFDGNGDDDDDDEDDDFDDDEENGEEADGEDSVNGNGAATPAAAPRAEYGGTEEERDAGDGVQRAAAVLKYIVENIVDEPDQISIGATEDDR